MVARASGPNYKLDTFIRACGLKKKTVIATKKAKEDAHEHYYLETEQKLLLLIANKGLSNIQFVGCDPLEKGRSEDIGKPVDGYTAEIGCKYVYFAFYLDFKSLWVLKSFHPSDVLHNAGCLLHSPFRSLGEPKK